MIYITQIIQVIPGQEKIFDEFESYAIPLIKKYNGLLVYRIRPNKDNIIESNSEDPYEIHLVSFSSQSDFDAFLKDDTRQKFLHLKNESVRSILLIKGEKLS